MVGVRTLIKVEMIEVDVIGTGWTAASAVKTVLALWWRVTSEADLTAPQDSAVVAAAVARQSEVELGPQQHLMKLEMVEQV